MYECPSYTISEVTIFECLASILFETRASTPNVISTEFIHKRIEELKVYERLPHYVGGSLTTDLEELYNAIIENNESFVLDYIHTKENKTIKNLGFTRDFNRRNKKI